MESKIGTRQMLNILLVLSWIVFIGVCIDAGGVLFSSFFTVVVNPLSAGSFWERADLSALFNRDKGQFLTMAFFMAIVAVLKVVLFYLIIKLLHNKKLTISQPFNSKVKRFIFKGAYVALGIAFFSSWGKGYAEWLSERGVTMPGAEVLHLGGADVWLFMSVSLLVIAQIFKRGIEIQTENELTI